MQKKVLIGLACITLIGLSGCAGMDNKPATKAEVTPTTQKQPTLSAEAQAALTAAQAEAKTAKAKNALWTTAEDALKAAEAAAEAGDSATVLKQAAIVQAHVKLGMGQLNYPLIPMGN